MSLVVDVEQVAVDRCHAETVRAVVRTLPKKARRFVELRYGLVDGCEWTLSRIADHLEITRNQARRLEARSLRMLRHPWRRRFLRA